MCETKHSLANKLSSDELVHYLDDSRKDNCSAVCKDILDSAGDLKRLAVTQS